VKQSQLDKAIAQLEAERQVLDLAIAKLKAQQSAKPKKAKLRAVSGERVASNGE
jgi:chorismate mutase